ncbi:hypothetical protein FQZ97_546890 [compost metagenome]
MGSQERIDLINQKRRSPKLNGAEQCCRCNVRDLEWTVRQFAQRGQQDRFSAAFFRGSDVGNWCDLNGVHQPRERRPQGGSAYGFLISDNMSCQRGNHFIEHLGGIYLRRPWLHFNKNTVSGRILFITNCGGYPVELRHAKHLGLLHLNSQACKGGGILAPHFLEWFKNGWFVQSPSIYCEIPYGFLDGTFGLQNKLTVHERSSSGPSH